jgi:D-alanine-D-alanine ligase
MGGPSAEREVSLRSGAAVASALRRLGFDVTEVDAMPGCVAGLSGIDLVFLTLHGAYGEDGTVQEELERANLPYTGCDAPASRCAFDKAQTIVALRQRDVPVAKSVVIPHGTRFCPENWSPPMVLKPVRQGSSVGLQFVKEWSQWEASLEAAMAHDCDVLMEEWVVGRELTVAILEGNPLPIIEICPESGPYDYHNKYTPGATRYLCPADLPASVTEWVQRVAVCAFNAVGGRDYGRVDILLRTDNTPVVLEVNTLPGMTETSLFPKAAVAAGWTFDGLCRQMVVLAWARSQGMDTAKHVTQHQHETQPVGITNRRGT